MSITSWSPSRLAKYDLCPLKFKLEVIDKRCPTCFKGTLRGEWGSPQICDACGQEAKPGQALVRGDDIGNRLDAYLTCQPKAAIPSEILHPKVKKIVAQARLLVKKLKAKVQCEILIDERWRPVKPLPHGRFTPAWLRCKLDIILFPSGREALVKDWKTGGIDKRTGEVRVESKYDDQLYSYAVAVLTAMPQISRVDSELVFLDAGPRYNPVVRRPKGSLDVADLPKAQKWWSKRVGPMFHDSTFAPRANEGCTWCPFQKGKGGPCPY